MTRCPETKLCTKSQVNIFEKRTISKILHTGRRFLNNILASYEQKKKFYAMQLVKQPISPFPLIDTNRHLGKEPMSSLLKNPS